jgi:hypothetical protein
MRYLILALVLLSSVSAYHGYNSYYQPRYYDNYYSSYHYDSYREPYTYYKPYYRDSYYSYNTYYYEPYHQRVRYNEVYNQINGNYPSYYFP